MRLTSLALSAVAALSIAACSAPAPAPVDPSPPAPVVVPSVTDRLKQLELPGGWVVRQEQAGMLTFALPSVTNPSNADAGVFWVATLSGTCSSDFAQAEARMSFGDDLPPEGRPSPIAVAGRTNVGFTWIGYNGVAGGAPPNIRFWCLSTGRAGDDLEVSAPDADGTTKAFVNGTLLPLWLTAR